MMQTLLNNLVNYLHYHPHWGGFLAFCISFIESLAIIGSIFPGSVTMTAIGALIGSDILPATSTLIWSISGAYIGDCLSYFIGIYYHDRLRNMWPFSKYISWLDWGKNFFCRHGGKSVIIGRFVGPMRSVIPLIAGLSNMPWPRFFLAALISATLWAIIYITPGVLLGALSLELPPKLATKFILYFLLAIIIISATTWLIRYLIYKAWYQFDAIINKIWHYLEQHKSSNWLVRLLAHPTDNTCHYGLLLLISSILSLMLFGFISLNIVYSGILTELNEPIFYLLQSIRTNHLDTIMLSFTLLGDKHTMLAIAGLMIIWLLWQRYFWTAYHILGLAIGATLSIEILKITISSPRPLTMHMENNLSFPSGHTTLSIALLGFLAFLLSSLLNNKNAKRWPYIIFLTIVALISFSRIYLGDHWLTDILGSCFLAATILLLTIISYRRKITEQILPLPLISYLAAIILSTWLVYGYTHLPLAKKSYAVNWPEQNCSQENWWQQAIDVLPLYRDNRLGRPEQILNLQWQGGLKAIQEFLEAQGWEQHNPKFDLATIVTHLTKDAVALPLLPKLYHNRAPELVMVKVINEQRWPLVLLLWQSDVIFTNNQLPLWIGSLSYYLPPHKLFKLYSNINKPRFMAAAEELLPDLKKTKTLKWHMLKINTMQSEAINSLEWDGNLLLIQQTDL